MRPNGVNTSYGYDSVSRLLSLLHQQGANTVDGAIYTYDNAGNRHSKQNLLNGVTENYIYDAIDQLKQVTQGATTTESYTYDSVGNRLSSLNVATYSYDSSNHLNSSSDGVSYTYDNNGNTLTKTDGNGTTQYVWDFDNRLKSVTLPNPGGTLVFKYDLLGRRIQKTSVAGTTNFVYDGSNMVAELSSTGAVVAKYFQGTNIDQPLAMSRGGVIDFYNMDGLSSITSVYDLAGMQAATYSFASFGNTSSTGGLFNPFQYTGREWDSDSGLHYYRARYYDAAVGRFISEDPIRFASDTTNFYAYVGNDPVDESDPFGLCPPDKQCFAQLKCRTVNDWRALGRQHCFWYVQGSTGIQYILGAGPNPPTGNNRMLNIWPPNPNTQTGVDNRGAGTAWDSGLSAANCPGVDAMIAAANGWPQNTVPYHEVTGPNSDTAAHYLGTQGGFNPPAPAGVMGWSTPLPPRPTPTPH